MGDAYFDDRTCADTDLRIPPRGPTVTLGLAGKPIGRTGGDMIGLTNCGIPSSGLSTNDIGLTTNAEDSSGPKSPDDGTADTTLGGDIGESSDDPKIRACSSSLDLETGVVGEALGEGVAGTTGTSLGAGEGIGGCGALGGGRLIVPDRARVRTLVTGTGGVGGSGISGLGKGGSGRCSFCFCCFANHSSSGKTSTIKESPQ